MASGTREIRSGFFPIGYDVKNKNIVTNGHICLFCSPSKGMKFNGDMEFTKGLENRLQNKIQEAKLHFKKESKLLFYAHLNDCLDSFGISSKPMAYFKPATTVENYVVFEDDERKRYVFNQTYMNMIMNRFKSVKYYIYNDTLFVVGIESKVVAILASIRNDHPEISRVTEMDKYFEKVEKE